MSFFLCVKVEWGIQGGWIYYGVCSCRRPQFLFFIQYRTEQLPNSLQTGMVCPPPTYSTHNTYLRIFVFDTYLIAS